MKPYAGNPLHGGCDCSGLIVLPDGDRGRCTSCNRPYGIAAEETQPRDRDGRPRGPRVVLARLVDLSPPTVEPGPSLFSRLGGALARGWSRLTAPRPRPVADTPATASTQWRTLTPPTI